MDLRIQDWNGDMALHIATKHGVSGQPLDFLLHGHHGMDAVNELNNQGRTALLGAIINSNTATVMALCPMMDVDILDIEGKTAMQYAIEMHESIYVDMLLERRIHTII